MTEVSGFGFIRSLAEAAEPSFAERAVRAVGWATVDLERSIAMARAEDGSEWAPGARDALLGARSARRVGPSVAQGVAPRAAPRAAPGGETGAVPSVAPAAGAEALEVVLLEPDTEGLLAATLARFGEGLAVAWFEPDPPGTRDRRSAIAQTPFGPGRLVLGGPRWGPHAIVLEARQP